MEATPLLYRPGCSTSCIRLDIADSRPRKTWPYWGVWRCINLANLSTAAGDHHARANGNPRASTSGTLSSSNGVDKSSRYNVLKRSASPEDAMSDLGHSARSAKKARSEKNTSFKRILTHTFHLQPYHAADFRINKGSDDHGLYPETLAVDLSAFPSIKYGGLQVASLSDTHFTGTYHSYSSLRSFGVDDLISCLGILHNQTDLLRLEPGLLRKVLGKAPDAAANQQLGKETALDFYYSLEVEIHLDIANLGNVDTSDMKKSFANLLPISIEGVLWNGLLLDRHHQEVLKPIEERSGKLYAETNLEYFYSCLPRPPLAGSYQEHDLKGKGKAKQEDVEIDEFTGSRPIEPPGLVPRLHPFQCRSLEWMLYREGKILAGRDHDGKQTVQSIKNPERKRDLRRSVMWSKAVFDDGEEWFFCPTSSEFSETGDESETMEGSILAEEMGLGKTVELLSLILLSQESERTQLPLYDAEWLATDVQPSNLTLLVCPLAIIGQWADEITRHAPALRVLRYSGMKTTYPKDDGKEVERTIRRFDVVLCDFDTMASDLAIARKPRLHHTRGQVARGNRVTYRRSVLVGIEWLRVILDEAQMAASTTSAISETASWIPRKYSWAVSGTPIKQTIKDLSGLLRFLRIYDVGSNSLSFQKLLKPELADVFSHLVSRIGIRTVKSQIEGELSLPPQERFIVPVNFTPIELYNYRARYGDALTELQFHMDASRLTSTWSIDRFLMSRWLHTLRQACFYAHAQAAAPNRERGNNGRKAEEVAIQTLDDILLDLRGKNISELHSDQRAAASAKVDRGYRVMYDKEECERYEKGLKILSVAKRDLHLLAQDIFNELLEIFPEARASDSESRANSTTPVPGIAGYPYLSVFHDKVRELMEKRNDQDSTTKAKNKTRLIASFSLRLREVLFIMHKTVFFIGNAYFNMGNKEEEETAAYAEADALRKQMLHTDEVEAMKEVRRLDTRIREKRITENEIMFTASPSRGGLESRSTFEDIDLLSQKANQIAGLMFKWRKFVIDALSADLTESEVTDTEYQSKAEAQERLDIHMEYLARIQADWIQIVTGTKSTLVENAAFGLAAKPVQESVNGQQKAAPMALAEMQDDIGTSKRSKRKQQMNVNNRKAIIAAGDPATKLRGELEAERKNVVPAFMRKKKKQHRTATRGHDEEESGTDEEDFPADTSLRERLRTLQRLKENALLEQEELIVAAEASRLRKQLSEKDRLIEKLRTEQNLFADVYNARVKFYRVMQEFGDAVAVLPDEEATPGALRAEIERLRQKEVEMDHQMLAKIARRRYLDSLKDANLAEEGCLICANTEVGHMVLTHCGHCMHEKCLRTWCMRSGSRTCPVCRASLNREKAWRKIQMASDETKIEAKAFEGAIVDTLAVNASASSSQLPESGTADMQVDDPEEVTDEDPSRQLKFLAPEEVEHILELPLAGASLGTKLDTIVKHVKLLRERHQMAIEKYDEDIAQGRGNGRRDTSSHSGLATFDNTGPPSEAKVLIYSAWQYACDVLAAAFRREDIRFVRLEGGSAGKKENAPLEFKENPDCTVFILHAKSQAAGLTLTAASYVFLVEPLLEPALETQAIARVHRIGQKRKTTVFQYIIPDTVDERIALLSLRKWKHTIFSCANSTGPVQESTITATISNDEQGTRKKISKLASKRIQEIKTLRKDSIVDGDALSVDDLARLVLDKDGMASLKVIQEQVALLAREKEEALARAREASDLLNLETLQANGDEGPADDWDEWDLGQHNNEWLHT